jgi:hypothetical protein
MRASEKEFNILSQGHHMYDIIYFIYCGSGGASSSSVSDVDHHVITKSYYILFSIFWWEIQPYYTGRFFYEVAYRLRCTLVCRVARLINKLK